MQYGHSDFKKIFPENERSTTERELGTSNPKYSSFFSLYFILFQIRPNPYSTIWIKLQDMDGKKKDWVPIRDPIKYASRRTFLYGPGYTLKGLSHEVDLVLERTLNVIKSQIHLVRHSL